MKRRLIASLSLILLLSLNMHAAKWRVNNLPGINADFTSFKAAHDAASPGDTLMFEGSNDWYGQNDTLFKALVIIGPGYFLNENDITNDNILTAQLGILYIDSLAAGAKIMGMSVMGGFDCLIVDASNVIIERNRVKGTIAFCYEKPVQNVVVSKNYCHEIDTRWGSPGANGTIVSNNIVTSGIAFNEVSTLTISHNSIGSDIWAINSIIKNNISGYLTPRDGSVYEYNIVFHGAPAGTGNVGNVNVAETFVADVTSPDGKYVLADASPAKTAGESKVDCGPFGGNDPYILSGFPPMPLIFNVEIPSAATESLLIKIEARSQK